MNLLKIALIYADWWETNTNGPRNQQAKTALQENSRIH